MFPWRSRLWFYLWHQRNYVYSDVHLFQCWISKSVKTHRGSHLGGHCPSKKITLFNYYSKGLEELHKRSPYFPQFKILGKEVACQPALISACLRSVTRLGVFLFPRGLDASPSKGYPTPPLNSQYPFIHRDRERHCERKVFFPKTKAQRSLRVRNQDHTIRIQ